MLKRMSWYYASASLQHDPDGGVLQQIAARFTKNKTQNAQSVTMGLRLRFAAA